MCKKAKLTHVYLVKYRKCFFFFFFFLLEVQLLGSGAQAGETKQTKTRPTTHRERKNHNRSL